MSRQVAIVDDSFTVRMGLRDAFEEAGFEVILCASVGEARALVAASPPSVLILDLMLPDGNGVDFLEELRRQEETAELPVLLLSTESAVRDRIRGLTRGADDYVGKPYDPAYVVARTAALMLPEPEEATTILVVDDSLTFRQELDEVLRGAGYATVLARSGEEGLRRAVEHRPAAVVVDGVMPGMDGTTMVRRIRLDPGLQSTPCLLLTASEGAADQVLALDAGADAYVHKSEGTPVVLARLRAMLRGALESRERAHLASLMGPKRILAVDDSLTYLESLTEDLRREGYEVVQARSGDEAIELLGIEEVDCILLDLLMPGLSGTETCRRIKSSPVMRKVPLIMLTALEEHEAMIEGIDAGADDYVSKSSDLAVLKARLRAQLRRKQIEDESRRVREEILQREAEARSARELAETRETLLARLEAKNRELAALNQELEGFAYSVSHDLRQPLRALDGFSRVLLDDHAEDLDEQGRFYLRRVRAGAQRMGELIDALLMLSRVTRQDLRRQALDLGELAERVIRDLAQAEPERQVELVRPADGPLQVCADPKLAASVVENLLGNAWKFSQGRSPATIEVGRQESDEEPVFFVRDNGVGFDMRYADRIFDPFQRLHTPEEFSGTGIGLATVQRIVLRHGGRLWAEGEPGRGATFYFSFGPCGPAGELP